MLNKVPLIVISAVGMRQGGTLTILRDCLRYLSSAVAEKRVRVVALVHKRELVDFPGIEYIEMPDVIKSWSRRLWCEYVTMHGISKQLPEADLWLSMHDTTPRVHARRQAVYCQTSFPFYKRRVLDFYFNYKIALFSLLTRFAYRINVHRNCYLVVQQQWFRDGLSEMLNVDKSRFIVAPPEQLPVDVVADKVELPCYTFFYPSAPDCHKNFEALCEAASKLEQEVGKGVFKAVVTLSGKENRYTRWLYAKWGNVDSIDFAGYMNKSKLYGYYEAADCLVFPSKVETWGLPISEFGSTGKPMIIADCPYAHGTASGFEKVAYFDACRPDVLKSLMKKALDGDHTCFHAQPTITIDEPEARSWEELFAMLLGKGKI